LRYLQAVAAYNQALVADPHNESAHIGLISLYRGAQRIDLWLRHVEALAEPWSRDPRVGPDQRQGLREGVAELRDALARIDDELSQLPSGDDKRVERAQIAMSRGRVLEALKELDAAAASMIDNPSAEQLRIRLLIEVGRVEEAHRAAEILIQAARQTGLADWPESVALARMCAAEYARAAEALEEGMETVDMVALRTATASLAPRPPGFPWVNVQAASNYLYARPQVVSRLKLHAALAQLERGVLTQSQQLLEESLAADPETPARPLIAYYLQQLTGENRVEPFPPSETVPGLFAPEPDAMPPETVE
jgi:tetratricopeptide (TPR) repeat protein